MSSSKDTLHAGKKLIGVISDTHGLVRPEVIQAFKGVDLILHAGDIGTSEVLQDLGFVAPVVAVRGNNDKGQWANQVPQWEVIQVNTIYIYILHNLNEIDLSPSASGFQVVVSGHSHKPSIEKHEGVLFINPGSAGPRRFKFPISVAYLSVEDATVKAELLELSVKED